MSGVPDRGEIEEQYKWDLESIYRNDEEWESAYTEAEELIEELAAFEGRVTEDADTLQAVLETYEETMRLVDTVAAYARMRRDEDTREQSHQAMATRAGRLRSQAESAASFIEPELQATDRETLEDFMAKESALAIYEHYFDDVLRKREHTRSTEVENVLAELGEVTGAPGDIYGMLSNADLEFPTVEDPDGDSIEITNANFTTLQQRTDRPFRKRVYEAYYDRWAELRNTVATAYEKSVTADVKLAQARDYETAREATLDEPNIPVDVYDTLLTTLRGNLDVLHRHAELKRETLGLEELRMWDVYVPLAAGESPSVSYATAKEYVTGALGALGDEYQTRVEEGLESRWVDVYENQGKRSGAYSAGTYDTQPFVLMNYQEDVASMFTLAHELGHSMHSELTSEQQPYIYSAYEIFVAEVASTVNEALLTHHVLEESDDDRLRRHVLDQYLERFRSTMFRQAMFADFELQAHRVVESGGALTPDKLDELFGDLKAEFYQPAVVDDRIHREWMRIPHFYRAYYVYQYATGISAAVAIARDILERGKPAADRYLEFLQQGSRKYPLELLDIAGVDMRSSQPVEAAITEYEERLDRMSELV